MVLASMTINALCGWVPPARHQMLEDTLLRPLVARERRVSTCLPTRPHSAGWGKVPGQWNPQIY